MVMYKRIVIRCSLIIAILLCSCGTKLSDSSVTSELVFNKCILSLTISIPDGWAKDPVPPNSKYKFSGWNYIDNVFIYNNFLKHSLSSDEGFRINLESPYYIGDKNIDSFMSTFDGVKISSIIKCGANHVYFFDPPKKGFIYVEKKVVLPMEIIHWPKKGMDSEMEAFFSSIHIP